ncbi:SusC/RagA family TonB-linked outer membrane protein [Flavobacterium sp.]|uniref:SusC/RagA family TonB-linked outer membrane protein n=1 Tax=Flavobacterium sp. TaxID=239 RepID=UPI0033413414
MRSKFKWIFTLLVAFTMQFSFAQQKTVTGTVTSDGAKLPGATVSISGTKQGTQTDENGKFSIKAAQGDVLEVSFLNKETKTVTVGAGNVIDITLASTSEVIEIVNVSIGYDRTRTKANSNTASTTVGGETLENRPNASVLASLQGTAPGLTIISSSGSPGSAKFDGFIRGASSINGNTDPLIVIDGIPSTSNQFRNLNQNEIESVTVLRDAAGTSIYGNKGANGVILIKTFSGKFGQALTFSYDTTTGFSTLPKNKYNMANGKQALAIEKLKNTGLGSTLTDSQIAAWNVDTDWLDLFYNTDVVKQHNLGISVGSKNLKSFTSLGYFDQGGLVPTTDFSRFTFRNNLSGKSNNDKFNFDSQIALGYSKRRQLDQETNGGVNNNTIQNPLHGGLMGLPYIAPSPYTTGQQLLDAIGTNFSGANDTYVLQDILKEDSLPSYYSDKTAILNVGASYKLTPTLTVRNRTGLDYKQYGRLFGRSPQSYLALVVAQNAGSQFGGFEDQSTFNDLTVTNISSLNYRKVFKDKHDLSMSAFFEYTKAHYTGHGSRQNGLNPLTYVPGAGTGYVAFNPATPNFYIASVNGAKLTGGTLSAFGTLDYDYDKKYGFSAVVRRDGTYRFSENNRWGTFWSASARWNIDQEEFMQNSKFSMLKLRASYGTNGNQNISAANYGFPSLLTSSNVIRETIAVGTGYNNLPGSLLYGNFDNVTVQWEKITQANFGIDFAVFNDKLEGNVDVYNKTTSNLFNSLPNSAVIGTGYSVAGNNGELTNNGIELVLKYNVIKNDKMKFSVFANSSYNENKITALATTNQSGVSNLRQVGNILNEWNLIPYVGVNQANGNLLYLDKDNKLTETPDEAKDRRATGKSNLPKYQGGFGFNFDYKGFYLNTLFTYMYDVWRIDNQFAWASNPAFIGGENVTADLLDQWTPTNTTSTVPSLNAFNNNVFLGSDRFLYDSSFIRLKNINLGYNIPSKLLKKSPFTNVKFFILAENLLTWTKWRGFDPEAVSALSVTNFPNPKTITFGTSIGF